MVKRLSGWGIFLFIFLVLSSLLLPDCLTAGSLETTKGFSGSMSLDALPALCGIAEGQTEMKLDDRRSLVLNGNYWQRPEFTSYGVGLTLGYQLLNDTQENKYGKAFGAGVEAGY